MPWTFWYILALGASVEVPQEASEPVTARPRVVRDSAFAEVRVRTGLNYSFGTKKYCHQIRKSNFKKHSQLFAVLCNSQRILTFSRFSHTYKKLLGMMKLHHKSEVKQQLQCQICEALNELNYYWFSFTKIMTTFLLKF